MVMATSMRGRMAPAAGALMAVALSLVAASCGGDGGGSLPPNTEPPGVNPNPQQTWVRCVCGGCSANGRPLGTDHLGGCVTSTCADTGNLNVQCATVCASYGLENCTAAAAEPQNFCENNRCEECTTASPSCTAGVCNQQAHSCGIECLADDGNCSQCDQCVVVASESPGTCLPQNATAVCTPASGLSAMQSAIVLPPGSSSYLDRYLGRLSVALNPSSALSFSASGASGSGSLSAGSLAMIAFGCPGPTCAVRLNDVLARANQINAQVTVLDVFGFEITQDISVTNAVITNVRPTSLEATPTGSLRIPPRGLEAMVAVTVEGTRFQVRTINDQDITGFINFTNGTVHLGGSFAVAGANVTFSLDGHLTNLAPQAVIAAPAVVECAGTTTPVAVDGSGSTDTLPGPGITQRNWFSPFSLATGTGTLLATTATASLPLPLGDNLVTLQVIDGEGALGLAQRTVTVRDTIAPRIVPTVTQNRSLQPGAARHRAAHAGRGRGVHAQSAADRSGAVDQRRRPEPTDHTGQRPRHAASRNARRSLDGPGRQRQHDGAQPDDRCRRAAGPVRQRHASHRRRVDREAVRWGLCHDRQRRPRRRQRDESRRDGAGGRRPEPGAGGAARSLAGGRLPEDAVAGHPSERNLRRGAAVRGGSGAASGLPDVVASGRHRAERVAWSRARQRRSRRARSEM